MRLISWVCESTSQVLGKTEQPILVVLPESVRYAIAHDHSRIGATQILSLLHPQYEFLGIWLALKYYEKDTEIFFHLFEKIVDLLGNNDTPDTCLAFLREKIAHDQNRKAIQTTGKISYIARMGFMEFCEGIGKLYTDRESCDAVVIVANSGLMGLMPVLRQLRDTKGEVIVCFPKLGSKHLLYLISSDDTHKILAQPLNRKDAEQMFNSKTLLIIDDISSTGKTEEKVSQMMETFGVSKIHYKTLIRFPQKSEAVTDLAQGMMY